MSCFYFLDTNYADSDLYNDLIVSSENADYPGINVLRDKKRPKVWRSAGYWNVTSSNNVLYIEEMGLGAGFGIATTIAVGEYHSAATFMAAVDAALEANGSANYTVTQSATTGKFIITSDLSGVIDFSILTADIGSTAAPLLGFDTSTDKTGSASYTSDILTLHQYEFLTFDLGMSKNIECVAILGNRNSSIALSPTAVIKIQGNTTNVWTTPEYEATLDYNEDCIFKLTEGGLHTTGLRYWRIYLEDKQNPNFYLEISKVFLGTVFASSRGGPVFGLSRAVKDLSVTVYSESGISLSDKKPKCNEISLSYEFMKKEDAEYIESIFEIYGTHRPIWLLLDSVPGFNTVANRSLKLVKFKNQPEFVINSPNNFSASIQFREEL